jgi:hypothetical protein
MDTREPEQQQEDPPRPDARWGRSAERRALQTLRYLCLAVIFLPSLVAFGLLIKRQVDFGQAVESAQSVASQASDERLREQKDLDFAADQLGAAQGELRIAESSTFGSVPTDALRTEVNNHQKNVDRATTDVKTAKGKDDAAQRAVIEARSRADRMAGIWLLYGGLVAAFIVAAILLYRYVRSEKYRSFENREILEQLHAADLATATGEPEDPLDFIALWRNNRDQLTSYHQLVLNYASSSRQTTILTLLAGFTFLLIVGVVAMFTHTLASAVTSSVVAAAGAAVTGFIGNAVLKNADTSSREVLAFFSHPLDVERTLAAERLIRAMPAGSQEAAKLLVIQSLTGTRGNNSGAGQQSQDGT